MTDAATSLRAKLRLRRPKMGKVLGWVKSIYTQAPLKDSYRSEPPAALVTLDSSSVTCKLSTVAAVSQAQAKIAGLHPRAGGDDPTVSGELCSDDVLREGLIACAGVTATLKAVSTALAIPLSGGGTFQAECDFDFRGTMGVDREAPVGLEAIRLKAIRLGFDVQLDGDLGEDGDAKIEKLGKLTERHWVALQTIAKKPEISVSVRRKIEAKDGVERGYAWGQKG